MDFLEKGPQGNDTELWGPAGSSGNWLTLSARPELKGAVGSGSPGQGSFQDRALKLNLLRIPAFPWVSCDPTSPKPYAISWPPRRTRPLKVTPPTRTQVPWTHKGETSVNFLRVSRLHSHAPEPVHSTCLKPLHRNHLNP